MTQIQQQGKDMLEIVEKYEVPYEYHAALWAAYEAGAELGFWKGAGVTDLPTERSSQTEANSEAQITPPRGDKG